MKQVSVLFLAKDEEKRIRSALESVRSFADEIVVIDDESVDGTRMVCEEYGARVWTRRLEKDFGAQYMFGFSKCRFDWILIMDADEVVPKETAQWILSWKKKPDEEVDGYYMKRFNHVWGQRIHWGGSDQSIMRLFRKGSVRVEGRVHSKFVFQGRSEYLDLGIDHFPMESIEDMIKKINFYTSLKVEFNETDLEAISRREIYRRLTWKPISLFLKIYIKKKGYKDGARGLAWALMNTIGPTIYWLKVLEKEVKNGKI